MLAKKFSRVLFSLLVYLNVVTLYAQSLKFSETSEKIENLLRYKEKSPAKLRDLILELEKHKSGNESEFNLLKSRVDHVLLPIDIKYARSDVYNKNYKNAVNRLNAIKFNYAYDKNIEKLEGYLDRKLFTLKKRTLLNTKPNWFSLEPSISLYSFEVPLKSISTLNNLNPTYGLGMYVRLNSTEKSAVNGKSIFRYSQLGAKLEYRDPNYIFLKDTSISSISPYFNSQISFIFKKTLGLDVGVISYSKVIGDFSKFYSFTGSVYIPIRLISIGVNARVITDFMSTNLLFQLGSTIKFNFGIYKSFTARDKEEIRSQIIKFKEGS